VASASVGPASAAALPISQRPNQRGQARHQFVVRLRKGVARLAFGALFELGSGVQQRGQGAPKRVERVG